MKITSPAFSEGQPIPATYTCEGADISPPLEWSDPPNGTVSFVLICDDPDAPMGTWVHWVVYGIPGDARSLSENIPSTESFLDGSLQGNTDFKGRVGYGGPCPPPGKPHRYYFTLYALGSKPDLPAGVTKAELLETISNDVLAECNLMGTFQR